MGKIWSEKDYTELQNNYSLNSNKELSVLLNRTPASISHKITQLKKQGQISSVAKPCGRPNYSDWTENDIKYIKQNYGIQTQHEIAIAINKSVFSVKQKIYLMKLSSIWEPKLEISDGIAGYIAGILDGEGSISINTSWKLDTLISICPIIHISNTSEKLIDYLQNIFSKSFRQTAKFFKDYRSRKKQWSIHVSGTSSTKCLLDRVNQYLIIKKPQADAMYKFFALDEANTGPRTQSLEIIKLAYEIRLLNDSRQKRSLIAREKLKNYIDNHS